MSCLITKTIIMVFENNHTTEELISQMLPGGHYSIETKKEGRRVAFLPSSEKESAENAKLFRNANKLIEIAQAFYDHLPSHGIMKNHIESVLQDCGTIKNK